MKVVQGRPMVWRWVLILLLFAVMIWGVVEIAGERSRDTREEAGPAAGEGSGRPETLDGDPAHD